MAMGTDTMRIDSPRFGLLDIEDSKVIDFPAGLAGFEACRRFTLFHPEGESPKFYILQSLDDPALAFYVTDPGPLGFSFEIQLSDPELELLQISDAKEAAVLVMLSKSEAGAGVQANLKAPLIINPLAQRGLQHIFTELSYAVAATDAEQP